MKHFTDPTYLRSIYDGLNSGAIHKNNASALPLGLVGMYEAAFPPTSNVNDRKKVLDFFVVWALLRREVSAAFVLPLLEGWTEEQLLEYIAQYSKWFNSPVSGKYQLYHERFRAFILQKISHQQFSTCNDLIINQCQRALLEKNENEWELYALECLSIHLLIKAMENGDDSALKSLSYNSTHWNRQVEISKGFEWSKRMLNDMMLCAYKYNEEEVIECALNKVDLHHLEQNDAPRIVELVTQNDIETALQRIESFGDIDKEGLQRKFILYMLCLMELTLLNSKDKSFRKEAIEKLLKHFDENLPIDHAILNWDNFFSSYLMLLMTCEWAELGLDYKIVYKRAEILEINWINEKSPYSKFQFEILLDIINGFDNDWFKRQGLMDILNKLIDQGMAKEGLEVIMELLTCTRNISDEKEKNNSFVALASELNKLGKSKEALEVIEEALQCAREISNNLHKNSSLLTLARELNKLGKSEEALDLIMEALACARGISDHVAKSQSLLHAAKEFDNLGEQTEALKVILEVLTCAQEISDDLDKNRFYVKLANNLNKLGKSKEALDLIKEALAYARGISDYNYKIDLLLSIANELDTLFMSKEAEEVIQEALMCSRGINDNIDKNSFLMNIAKELKDLGKSKEALEVIMEALACARGFIDDDNNKIESLLVIAHEMDKLGNSKEALEVIQEAYDLVINFDEELSYSVLADIADSYAIIGNIEKYLFVNEQIISKCDDIYFREYIILKIQQKLITQGSQELIPNILIQIINKNNTQLSSKSIDDNLLNISLTLINHDKIEMAFLLLNEITDNFKNKVLIEFSKILIKKDKISKSRSWEEKFIDEDTGEFLFFQNEEYIFKEKTPRKFTVKNLDEITEEIFNNFSIAKNGGIDFELLIQKIDKINDDDKKISSFVSLSNLLFNHRFFEFASKAIFHALNIIQIRSNHIKFEDESIKILAESLIGQGQFLEVFNIVNLIEYEYTKNRLLALISIEAAVNNLDDMAFKTIMSIEQESVKFDAWSELGKLEFNKEGILFCKNKIEILPNDTAITYYLKGMAEAINATNANASNVLELLELVKEDTKSIVHLLQMHALYLCFFEKTNPIKMQRLNKTLNIQWALDIAAKFEKEFERASQNVQEWINEIVDENDREDVLGWAEKVEQGKMTEEKFLERVNKL